MLTTTRHFRIVQVFCILVVLSSFQVALKVDKTSLEVTPLQWVLIGMGVWATISGFILERQIVRYPNKSRPSTRSTTVQSLESRRPDSRCERHFSCRLGANPTQEWWPGADRQHFLHRRRIVTPDMETQGQSCAATRTNGCVTQRGFLAGEESRLHSLSLGREPTDGASLR
jgi:hypothetical protein